MAKTMEITTPSGLTGEIRNLKIQEGNVLADRKIAKSGKLVDEILKRCWVTTRDRGLLNYDHNKDGTVPEWDKVLSGDRIYAFIQVRILTFPDTDYDFQIRCVGPSCGESFGWTVNLNELPVKKLSDASAKIYLAGNKFSGKLADGTGFTYRLMRGVDERNASKKLTEHPDQRLTVSLASRITAIEGVADQDIGDYLGNLDMPESLSILDLLEENDCGLETGIEVECPHCLHEFEADIPFSGDFFFPKPKRKSTTQKAKEPARDGQG